MTKQEFLDNDWTVGTLIDFCYENNLDTMCNFYDENEYDERVNNDMYEHIGNWNWNVVRDWLDDLPDKGYSYYIIEDGEYIGVGNYDNDIIDEYRGYIVEDMDLGEYWDEEIEDLVDDEYEDAEVEDDMVFEFVESDFIALIA